MDETMTYENGGAVKYLDLWVERAQFKKKRIRIEELVNSAGKAFGVTGGEVMGGSQRQKVSLARSVVCDLGLRDLGMTGRE